MWRFAEGQQSYPRAIGFGLEMPKARLNSGTVLELDPEVTARMKNIKASFQKC
jgi:hypothetical protein